jgi:hypothetical protein
MGSRIRHAGEVRRDVNRVNRKQGHDEDAKRLPQQSHPSSWSKCRHEKVGAQTAYESARIRSQSYMVRRTDRIAQSGLM